MTEALNNSKKKEEKKLNETIKAATAPSEKN